MSFDVYLKAQLKAHPGLGIQDAIKLCYQAAHGPEHILENEELARAAFEKEFTETPVSGAPLWENISEEYMRIDLSAWKKRAMPPEWFFEMFRLSAVRMPDADEKLEHYLDRAGAILPRMGFSAKNLWDSIAEYKDRGMQPVHHSERYCTEENPHYRVVSRKFESILPILEKTAKVQPGPCVIAIDGRAASGKTTMAGLLSKVLNADVVHMDDFFLPPVLRTLERLNEPGGNIHYERFLEEVIPYLRSEKGFSYRIFSCQKLDYTEVREIKNENCVIVEGSYSLHPKFGNYADVRVFSSIDQENQQKRIFKRDGNAAFEFFRNKWIPMEEAYFEEFKIAEKCDVRV